jgi:hypothetical protein
MSHHAFCNIATWRSCTVYRTEHIYSYTRYQYIFSTCVVHFASSSDLVLGGDRTRAQTMVRTVLRYAIGGLYASKTTQQRAMDNMTTAATAMQRVPSIFSVAATSTTEPAPCPDRSAYLTLLTVHAKATDNARVGTFFQKQGMAGFRRQIDLMLVLLFSLREHESCRRDFVLLVGTGVELGQALEYRLRTAGVVMKRVPPVRWGRPTLDKLHAWNLTQYGKVLIMDSDSIALQSLDAVFTGREGTMGHHPYELFQKKCDIPPDKRGQGGFFMIEPREHGYEQALRHVDSHPEYWDMTQTNHTPQQTGISCYFKTHTKSLHVLPCPTWYDISVRYHLRGAQHYKQCKRWQPDPSVCDVVADLIEAQCLWRNVSHDVRAVHLKGSTKPYRNIAPACNPLKKGGVGALSANGSKALIPLSPRDDLVATRSGCHSRDKHQPVRWLATGQLLAPRCCNSVNLVKAEWWRLHRLMSNSGEAKHSPS